MMEYMCPRSIQDLFEESPESARVRAIEWVISLDLQIGDRVFLPEIGWCTKTEAGLQ